MNEFGRNARLQLEKVQNAGERIRELEGLEADAIGAVLSAGRVLSETRSKAAGELSRAVETELNDLSLAGAQFAVSLSHTPSAHGLEIEPGVKHRVF